MKAQILKIAGVKSEKEFYKKYPSEEAFMKQHGKAFKKAQIGAVISGGDKSSNPKILGLRDFYDDADLTVTGMTDDMRQKQAAAMAAQAAAAAGSQPSGGGGGGGLGSILGMLGGGEGGEGGLMSMLGGGGGEGAAGAATMLGGARYGTNIPRAQMGTNMPSWYQDTPNMNNVISSQTKSPGVNANMYKSNTAVGRTAAPGNYNSWDIDNNGVPDTVQGAEGNPLNNNSVRSQIPSNAPEKSGFENTMSGIAKYAGPAGKIYEGFQALKAEKAARKDAEQQKVVSDVTLAASKTRPEEIKRKYVRPEDIENTGEEFFPIYGVGTNVLARNGMRLQSGGMIGGNPTEIQNTYGDGNSIYDDLGYEPLIDYNQQKSFRHGGRLYQMQDGGAATGGATAGGGADWGAISGMATNIGQTATGGQNAGGQIGSTVGSTAGMLIGGPVGGAIGGFVGGMAGNLLDTNPKRTKQFQGQTKRNITQMGLNSGFQSVNAGNASYVRNGGDIPSYEDGGYMNPEYNPQVITMFGDHDAEDFADYANKYRAGGHLKSYTPPSERAMETYEDGGEITSYGMGGQLKTHWGGEAETMSYNPYLPGSGETVVFRGQSHTDSDGKGNTGIGITYGENPVEVERGEPMFEMESGGEINPETGEPENTGVVFGNMKVDKKIASQINDPDLMEIANIYNGKKFKNIGIDLSKQEAKQNKIIDKNSKLLDSFKVESSLDKAKLAGFQAMLEGADAKLRNIANTKITLANYQNAINDTKEELSDAIGENLSAEDLARGYIKLDKDPVTKDAKWGGNIAKKAKAGATTTDETTSPPKSFKSEREAAAAGYRKGEDGKYYRTIKKFSTKDTETKSADALGYIPAGQKKSDSGLWGKVTPEQFEETKRANAWYPGWSTFDPKNKADVKNYQRAFNARAKEMGSSANITDDGDFGEQTVSARIAEAKKSEPATTEETLTAMVDEPNNPGMEEKSKFPWWAMLGNTALNYLRPTDQEALDMAQLYPEMYAMSSNQLEPVPTQGYQPELGVPYDISFQDQLNANQADYRAMQRVAGYNPAAQANLNAQKYQANQKVLGEQFRANQAMKDKVYGENRNILNQAKLTNLGIYDKQYERQAQALSNTKATTQAALSSISDKYAKNKLENRKLSIYENMYNYRFGKSGRAQSYNPLQFFDTEMSGGKSSGGRGLASGKEYTYDANGNIIGVRNSDKDSVTDYDLEAVGGIKGKNGMSTKKNYKNSSVVRAFKNL